jgi:hypothetical protein
MGLENAGYEEQPTIPEDYYWGVYEEMNSYEKEEGQKRLNVVFRVENDGEEVDVSFNTSHKLSMYGNDHSSKLGAFIEAVGLEEVIDEALDADGGLADGSKKFTVKSEEDEEKLRKALKIAFSGKKFRLNVIETDEDDNFIDSVSEMQRIEVNQESENEGKEGE